MVDHDVRLYCYTAREREIKRAAEGRVEREAL